MLPAFWPEALIQLRQGIPGFVAAARIIAIKARVLGGVFNNFFMFCFFIKEEYD